MNAKQGTYIIADQIITLLETIDDVAFQKAIPIFNGSTIGQHFRHILDFYTCLIKGLERPYVDYSFRERNPDLEKNAALARKKFEEIMTAIKPFDEDRVILIKADFHDGDHAKHPLVTSSIGRELMYAYDHAVHHLAIIKIGLQVSFPDFPVHSDLGVAPSTIRYQLERKKDAAAG